MSSTGQEIRLKGSRRLETANQRFARADPDDIRFSESVISSHCSMPFEGLTLQEAVDLIKSGEMEKSEFPVMQVLLVEEQLWTLDNETLWVLRKARVGSVLVNFLATFSDAKKSPIYTDVLYPQLCRDDFFPRMRQSSDATSFLDDRKNFLHAERSPHHLYSPETHSGSRDIHHGSDCYIHRSTASRQRVNRSAAPRQRSGRDVIADYVEGGSGIAGDSDKPELDRGQDLSTDADCAYANGHRRVDPLGLHSSSCGRLPSGRKSPPLSTCAPESSLGNGSSSQRGSLEEKEPMYSSAAGRLEVPTSSSRARHECPSAPPPKLNLQSSNGSGSSLRPAKGQLLYSATKSTVPEINSGLSTQDDCFRTNGLVSAGKESLPPSRPPNSTSQFQRSGIFHPVVQPNFRGKIPHSSNNARVTSDYQEKAEVILPSHPLDNLHFVEKTSIPHCRASVLQSSSFGSGSGLPAYDDPLTPGARLAHSRRTGERTPAPPSDSFGVESPPVATYPPPGPGQRSSLSPPSAHSSQSSCSSDSSATGSTAPSPDLQSSCGNGLPHTTASDTIHRQAPITGLSLDPSPVLSSHLLSSSCVQSSGLPLPNLSLPLNASPEATDENKQQVSMDAKRKRGRPRKVPLLQVPASIESVEEGHSTRLTEKREREEEHESVTGGKRGRPRKLPLLQVPASTQSVGECHSTRLTERRGKEEYESDDSDEEFMVPHYVKVTLAERSSLRLTTRSTASVIKADKQAGAKPVEGIILGSS